MRSSLLAVLCFLLPAALASADPPESRPPNIVLLLADDLGWGELGVQGGKDIPTPHLDALAQSGVRFTQAYVTCPVCAPTRAGLLTGRYQQRFGFENNPGPQGTASGKFGLPRDQKTLAERLRERGYATGMFGKWHLGYEEGLRPTERGFDEFLGFLGGAHSYFAARAGGKAGGSILRGTEPVDEERYLTDALGREAAQFVARHRDEPFFLYVPFNAVHSPMQAPTEALERFPDIDDPRRQTFAAMLSALDDSVGRVLAALEKNGLSENTLVIFLADNGGPTPSTTSSNGILRGTKATVWEGGIRVPFFVRWPTKIPGGKVDDRPVISLDVVPTVLAAVGAAAEKADRLDGVDLLPHLSGGNDARPHERLYWRFGEQAAIRQGDWKLVMPRGGEAQLFDLASDPGETEDLFEEQPEIAAELAEAWGDWSSELMEPSWSRGNKRRR